MEKHEEQRAEAERLRAQAVEQVWGRPVEVGSATADVDSIIHELQVHQVELETQNEALRQTRDALGAARANYIDLYDFAPVGYVTVDDEGGILQANLTLATMLGVERGFLIGEPLARFLVRDEANVAGFHRSVKQAQVTEGSTMWEALLECAGGSHVNARIVAKALPSMDERGSQCRIAIIDETELTRSEERRAQAEDEAERERLYRAESLVAVAGGVAHDFNNWLTVILGNLELMQDGQDHSEDVIEGLEEIRKAGRKCADLSHQMRLFSGFCGLERLPHDLPRLVEDEAEIWRCKVPASVRLALDLVDRTPTVGVSEAEIRLVLNALMINAIEAIDDRPGRIDIKTGALHIDDDYLKATTLVGAALSSGSYAFVCISDTGCGMSDEIQSRMFDPFYSTKFVGRGLGLSAAHGIARAHQGAISFRSEQDIGSCFTLILPPLPPRGD